MAAKQKKPWHGTGRKARSHVMRKGDSMTRKQFTLTLATAAVFAGFIPAQAQTVNAIPCLGVDANVGINNTDVILGSQSVQSDVTASQAPDKLRPNCS